MNKNIPNRYTADSCVYPINRYAYNTFSIIFVYFNGFYRVNYT